MSANLALVLILVSSLATTCFILWLLIVKGKF